MPTPPKPDYKAAANAYAELWRQSEAPAPLGTSPPRPPVGAAAAKAAALDERKSMPLPAFQRMVGDDAFIPPDRLRFLKRIGAGSFATVEVADYTPPDGSPPVRVAVKKLRTGSQLSVADLAHEARLLKQLTHPNIVRYVGVGAAESRPGAVIPDNACYIVQDYVSGGTLKRAVAAAAARKRGDPRPYRCVDAAAWGAGVARGLAYLHGANPVILHRDLKLENVLLTRRAAAKDETDADRAALPPGRGQTAQLADFGLAVSFVSPDIDSRRSQLMDAALSTSGASATGASVGARLGEPLASTVAEQMARADRGETMTDPKIKKAANALETALSAWSPGGDGGETKTPGGSGSALTAPRRARTPRPRHRLTPANRHVYALTGKTGSYLYMAPCVTLCLPYNERADLFSLGCVLWELFSGRTLASVVLASAAGGPVSDPARVAELYAHRVARGFRPPLPPEWPERVRALVTACWRAAPADRPTAAAVADELEAMLKDGVLAEWDEAIAAGTDDGGADADEDWDGGPQCCVCF